MRRLSAVFAGLIGSILLVAGPQASVALAPAAKAPAPAAPAAPEAHALTQQDVDGWLDGFVPYALKSGDVAGAVVVVVKDGKVLTERGYGYADVASERPVDPKATLFRPGSISKLYTWTAVLQLVEAGKLDLDADVNKYLDFNIPEKFGKPITLRNLMTHTPGFEEVFGNILTTDPKRYRPLGETMKRHIPERMFPPGEVDAYSNYGASLAGYIVERVSGEPYDAYIAHHILQPLGMAHSTFTQPLPADLKPLMASGYKLGSQPAHPFEYVEIAPAGSMSVTGDDMSHFMIAHMQDGRYGSAQILKPETAKLMHSPAFVLNPPLPTAMGLGIVVDELNGHPTIGHNGATELFFSDLVLFPKDQIGIFVSANSAGKAGAGGAFEGKMVKAFADRYLPATPHEDKTWPTAKKDAATVAGAYWPSRRVNSNLFRLAYLFNQMHIAALPDGQIQIDALKDDGGVKPLTWREVGPYVWRDTKSDSRIAAIVKDGKVVSFSAAWFQPVPKSLQSGWNVPLLCASLAILALVVLLWPISAWARGRYGKSFTLTGRSATLYRLTRVAALASVACIASWVLLILSGTSELASLDNHLVPWIRITQLLGLFAIAGTVVSALNLVTVWGDGSRSWFAKVSSLLIVAASASVVWIILAFKLLTLSTNF
jgi:CubicO group peptidase (beta-lactamase class C family)